MKKRPARLIFIDETGTTTEMTRLRGRARRGQRLEMKAPFGHWGTQTVIAALRHDGLTAPRVIDGPINRDIFKTYILDPRVAALPMMISAKVYWNSELQVRPVRCGLRRAPLIPLPNVIRAGETRRGPSPMIINKRSAPASAAERCR